MCRTGPAPCDGRVRSSPAWRGSAAFTLSLIHILPDRIYYTILRYEKYVMGVVILLVLVGVFDKPLSFLMVHVLQGFCTLTGMPLGG